MLWGNKRFNKSFIKFQIKSINTLVKTKANNAQLILSIGVEHAYISEVEVAL